MAFQLLFQNGLGSPVYTVLFYTCPVPNRLSSLVLMASPLLNPNTTNIYELPQHQFAFTWDKYNQKNKGIFTKDNQVQCMYRFNNVITFSNNDGPHFLNQTGFPKDEFNIKVDGGVRNNAFYGGLCLGGYPMFAQIMQPGDTQRYPSAMKLNCGYSLQPIVQGQVLTPSTLKSIDVSEYQGANQIFVFLDQDGNLHPSAQATAGAEATKANG